MQCNHLDRKRSCRDPVIARFWDQLVAQADKYQLSIHASRHHL
jgi:hypothetical protein